MLSKEEVEKIAKLARLALSPQEVSLYQDRLGRVLEHINELNKIKFEKLEFVQHAPVDSLAFRADEPRSSGVQEAIMKNAPQSLENSFMLPPIMDHE